MVFAVSSRFHWKSNSGVSTPQKHEDCDHIRKGTANHFMVCHLSCCFIVHVVIFLLRKFEEIYVQVGMWMQIVEKAHTLFGFISGVSKMSWKESYTKLLAAGSVSFMILPTFLSVRLYRTIQTISTLTIILVVRNSKSPTKVSLWYLSWLFWPNP